MDTPLVSTAMHWMTEMADTVPAIDRNEKETIEFDLNKPTKRVAAKRVERNLEGGAEVRKREVGHGGQGVVGDNGEHEGAANHVAWNKHIALSH